MGKVVENCTAVLIHHENFDHSNKDKEMYRRACNMTELSKHFKNKSGTSGSEEKSSEK